jgi:hypothetical protein
LDPNSSKTILLESYFLKLNFSPQNSSRLFLQTHPKYTRVWKSIFIVRHLFFSLILLGFFSSFFHLCTKRRCMTSYYGWYCTPGYHQQQQGKKGGRILALALQLISGSGMGDAVPPNFQPHDKAKFSSSLRAALLAWGDLHTS